MSCLGLCDVGYECGTGTECIPVTNESPSATAVPTQPTTPTGTPSASSNHNGAGRPAAGMALGFVTVAMGMIFWL
jgi:hypothetical protein